jgi:hypothetical protein
MNKVVMNELLLLVGIVNKKTSKVQYFYVNSYLQ